MADEEAYDRKKKRIIEAYISHKEVSHQRAFTPPPSSQRIEIPTLTVKARPLQRPDSPGRRERLPIREIAMRRSEALRAQAQPHEDDLYADRQVDREEGPYVRDGIYYPRTGPPVARDSHSRISPYLYRRRSGFRLVKDGADLSYRSRTKAPPKRRISLYDLYAPREGEGEEEGEDIEVEVETEEEHTDTEEGVIPNGTEHEDEVGETDNVPSDGGEKDISFREEASALLWGRKKKRAVDRTEMPILKEGPDPREQAAHTGRPGGEEGDDVEMEEEEEGVMGAAGMTEAEHEAGAGALEESGVAVGATAARRGGISMDEEALEAESEVSPAGSRGEELDDGADGSTCVSCGLELNNYNRHVECTSCGATGCTTCNAYDMEHQTTNVYYDYIFDHPLCINCYQKAFNIQKMLGKATMCFGNGNLTYAQYYAQNALKMGPDTRYAADATKLLERIEQVRVQREEQKLSWTREAKRLSRAKFQDPGWKR